MTGGGLTSWSHRVQWGNTFMNVPSSWQQLRGTARWLITRLKWQSSFAFASCMRDFDLHHNSFILSRNSISLMFKGLECNHTQHPAARIAPLIGVARRLRPFKCSNKLFALFDLKLGPTQSWKGAGSEASDLESDCVYLSSACAPRCESW